MSRNDSQEQEGARIALAPRVTPITASENTEANTENGSTRLPEAHSTHAATSGGPPPGSPRQRRRLAGLGGWLMATTSLVLVAVLALLFADSARPQQTQGKAAPTPTATAKPTPTSTPYPLPTPMTGFQVYADRADGFFLQYPTGWTTTPSNPGVELTDDSNSPTFIVQVLIPAAASITGAGANASDPSALVNFELNTLATQWPAGAFTHTPGPNTVTTIGGVQWQGGVGLVSTSANDATNATPGAHIKVQVYATVYHGKPYVINLLAPNDLFQAGMDGSFSQVLSTFTFLPVTRQP